MKPQQKSTKIKKAAAKPSILTWRPRAKTKVQKARLAMQTHHRAQRAPDTKCSVASCKKTCVMGYEYCALHRCMRLQIANIPVNDITYGA